jgi:hypothetical protein
MNRVPKPSVILGLHTTRRSVYSAIPSDSLDSAVSGRLPARARGGSSGPIAKA